MLRSTALLLEHGLGRAGDAGRLGGAATTSELGARVLERLG